MLTTSTTSNYNGTLNPEAHEFQSKSLADSSSKSNEESSDNNARNGKKRKGKHNLINYIINIVTF